MGKREWAQQNRQIYQMGQLCKKDVTGPDSLAILSIPTSAA